jgi:hypothetical protein
MTDMATPDAQQTEVLPPPLSRLRRFAKAFFFLQLALIPVTIVGGDFIVGGIDLVAHTALGMNKVAAETNQFWQALSVSLTASLALCAFKLWRDPRKNIDWALPILTATGTASCCLPLYYLYYGALSLLLGAAFQFVLFAATLFFWWRGGVSLRVGG